MHPTMNKNNRSTKIDKSITNDISICEQRDFPNRQRTKDRQHNAETKTNRISMGNKHATVCKRLRVSPPDILINKQHGRNNRYDITDLTHIIRKSFMLSTP